MALVMVQGHLCDSLLRPEIRAEAFYQFQTMFHGSTAPGFLFASGFVAGLPRAPLSPRAGVRRARRLLFVLLVGSAPPLPYFSCWQRVLASPAEKAALFGCHALQVIAVTQLLVLGLQAVAGRLWIVMAALLAVVVLAAGPWVWSSGLSTRLPPAMAPYVDQRTGSTFPGLPRQPSRARGPGARARAGAPRPRAPPPPRAGMGPGPRRGRRRPRPRARGTGRLLEHLAGLRPHPAGRPRAAPAPRGGRRAR